MRSKHKLLKKLGQEGASSSDEEDLPTLGTTSAVIGGSQLIRPEAPQADN